MDGIGLWSLRPTQDAPDNSPAERGYRLAKTMRTVVRLISDDDSNLLIETNRRWQAFWNQVGRPSVLPTLIDPDGSTTSRILGYTVGRDTVTNALLDCPPSGVYYCAAPIVYQHV